MGNIYNFVFLNMFAKIIIFSACLSVINAALSQSERDAVLDVHNDYRAVYGLTPMVYSTTVEDFSETFTAGCPLAHSSSSYGENLYWNSRSGADRTDMLVGAVHAWMSEDYRCATRECFSFTCGHWTQVMWENSRNLGCGVKTDCDGQWTVTVTCNYDPPGNYRGQDPFPIDWCDRDAAPVTPAPTVAPVTPAPVATPAPEAQSLEAPVLGGRKTRKFIEVSWNQVEGADGYKLLVDVDGKRNRFFLSGDTLSKRFRRPSGTFARFVVWAMKGDETSPPSEIKKVRL